MKVDVYSGADIATIAALSLLLRRRAARDNKPQPLTPEQAEAQEKLHQELLERQAKRAAEIQAEQERMREYKARIAARRAKRAERQSPPGKEGES